MRIAFSGDRFAVVLEFEFLSGKMVGMQSMETWRCDSAIANASEPNSRPV
jgi:hypothetical protein